MLRCICLPLYIIDKCVTWSNIVNKRLECEVHLERGSRSGGTKRSDHFWSQLPGRYLRLPKQTVLMGIYRSTVRGGGLGKTDGLASGRKRKLEPPRPEPSIFYPT